MKNKEDVLITTAIILLLFSSQTEAGTKPGINSKPYHLLCAIYRTLESSPTSLYDTTLIADIKDEIDVINASLSEDDRFNQISGLADQKTLPENQESQRVVPDSRTDRWRRAIKKVSSSNNNWKKLPSGSKVVRLAQIRINKIEEQVDQVVNKIETLQREAKLDEISRYFTEAVGTAGSGKDFGIGATNRNTACGIHSDSSNGKGTKAGSNLVTDFLCICASKGASGTDADGSQCTSGIPGNSDTANWAAGKPGKPDEVWEALRDKCPTGPATGLAKSARGRLAVANFLAEIGEGQVSRDSSPKVGRLGAADSTVDSGSWDCDGALTANKGVCIYYGNTDWENSITWLNKMQNGLSLLEKAENTTFKIQADIAQLKMLKARAEEIYGEAKASLDLENETPGKNPENQNQKQNPTTLTDTTTVKEPTAMSATPTPRLIMPLTLLI